MIHLEFRPEDLEIKGFSSITLIFFLVTVLLLRRDSMTKAMYKRKYLIGGLFIVSEGKSMTIKARSLAAAGKQVVHVTIAIAGSLHLAYKQ